jgi:hypothetical protein
MVDEPDHLCCPVTLELLRDPVLVFPEGLTFESSVIGRLRRTRAGKCRNPLTRKFFSPTRDVAPNIALRDAVTAWKVSQPHFEEEKEVLPQQEEEVLPPEAPPLEPSVADAGINPVIPFTYFQAASALYQRLQQEEGNEPRIVPVAPPPIIATPNLFMKLRMFQQYQTYEEFEVLRVLDHRGHVNFTIQNSPYTGTTSTSPRTVNTSGRSWLGNEKIQAQRDLQNYIRTLSGASVSTRKPCFRLFWLLFVCRFQYPAYDDTLATLTVYADGSVKTEDRMVVGTRYLINRFLRNNV